MLGYLFLLALFLLLFLLCFCFGLSEWLHPRDQYPIAVDVQYVREENYFGTAFRAKMLEWLRISPRVEPQPSDAAGNVQAVFQTPAGERICVLAGGCAAQAAECNNLIYCEGDIRLAENTAFHKEMYIAGNFRSGASVNLQSVAADGHIVLGLNNEVARWLDSSRTILLRSGTTVGSRISAANSIEMEPNVLAKSLYAPLIFTSRYGSTSEFALSTGSQSKLHGLATSPSPALANAVEIRGARLSPDTWLVAGDMKLHDGESVRGNIIVQGTLRSGQSCCFDGSVKAQRIELGAQNMVSGNLVSDGAALLGEGTQVSGNIAAETDILLRVGTRVGTRARLAAVSAGRDVTLEANVAVCGKIVAGRKVLTS
ncbi:MAG: hypothetical protein HYX72_06415 [Acidobacteria bacterium]|nr:hypothetical protein [Acidobacteriota bacterium]